MTWFSSLADKYQGTLDRKARVQSGAVQLFQDLRTQAATASAAYNTRFPTGDIASCGAMTSTAAKDEFTVSMNARPEPGALVRSATITLLKPNLISAVYSTGGAPLVITVDLDAQGYVCLMNDDEKTSMDDALTLLLGSFLFPDNA